MNRFSRIFLPLVLVVVAGLFVLATLPVRLSRENSAEVKALVTKVSNGGMQDIVISLDGKKGMYYISKASKNNLTSDGLAEVLTNREVSVLYSRPRALSLLNPMTNTLQITELRLGD